MAENSILQELAKIEESLKNIKSAKKQVDAVIVADKKIADTITITSNSLNELAIALENIKTVLYKEFTDIATGVVGEVETKISRINKLVEALSGKLAEVIPTFKAACNKINADFDTGTAKASKDFQKRVEDCIANFSSTTGNSLTKLDKLVTSSTTTINNAIAELSASSKQFAESKKSLLPKLDSITSSLSKVYERLDAVVKKQIEIVKHIDDKASAVLKSSEQIDNKLSALATDISNLSQTVTDSYDDVKAEIASLKKQNLLLLIAAIIAALLAVITNFAS